MPGRDRLAGARGRMLLVIIVQLLLVVNGVPAFVLLMSLPTRTDHLFVWTVNPPANARVLGVMYGNALILAVIGLVERSWPRIRITFVVIALFSVAATIATFFTLDPFRAHPWLHLAYWLTMYFLLFLLAPAALVWNERREGGRLPVDVPLGAAARAVFLVMSCTLAFAGLGLLFFFSSTARLWPFGITPLVGHILGVWFSALAAAHLWALWDGDLLRTRPLYLQAGPTGALLALILLLNRGDLRTGASGALAAYLVLALGMVAEGVLVPLSAAKKMGPGALPERA